MWPAYSKALLNRDWAEMEGEFNNQPAAMNNGVQKW